VFKAGDKLKQGRYQLKDKILDGRFTSIWRATDQQKEGASVVVKVGEPEHGATIMPRYHAELHRNTGYHQGMLHQGCCIREGLAAQSHSCCKSVGSRCAPHATWGRWQH
jgi:hypothetical protein